MLRLYYMCMNVIGLFVSRTHEFMGPAIPWVHVSVLEPDGEACVLDLFGSIDGEAFEHEGRDLSTRRFARRLSR